MTEVNRDTFADLVNAALDQEDSGRMMRRFTVAEGQQAWDARPEAVAPDAAVRTYVENVVAAYREMPDHGGD